MNNDNFKLCVVGINHKTSNISEREVYQLSKKEISGALNYIYTIKEVEGVIIISTCNRVEFYLVLKQNIDPFSIIKDFYFNNRQVDAESKRESFYIFNQSKVARHLFRVVSGLESVLLGEYQIQGQIKDSYSVACSEKTADKILHKLFHAAFRTAKSVRTHTEIGSGKQSLSGVAYQLINDFIKREEAVTIVGVNENTKIIAKKLNQSGFINLNFINRTRHKAEELAEKYNGTAYCFDGIEEPLVKSKCLISCTGSPDYVISSDLLNRIYDKSNHLELIIDMAIPRDVDTKGISEDIRIVNLEGLNTYLEKQRIKTTADLSLAEKIIVDEANIFEVWSEAQQDDVFAPFVEKMELMRQQLLEETNTQLSDEEYLLLEKFSRSLIHRLKATVNEALRTNTDQKKAS
jgi:glutamyl-tRNA reductase